MATEGSLPATSSNWQAEFILAWRAKNRIPAQFRQLVESHNNLVRQNAALTKQKSSAETQLLILQHESTTTVSAKAQQQLENRVRELQEELLSKAKLETEIGDLRLRVLSAEKDKEDAQRGFEALKVLQSEVTAERDALKATEGVLQSELEATRKMLAAREEECDKLRSENGDIVMRLLEDKAATVGEMNKMNDLVETLQRQVAELKHAEAQRLKSSGGGGCSNDSRASDAADRGRSGGGGRRVVGSGGSGWSLSGSSVCPTSLRHQVKAHHTEANCVAYSRVEPLLFTGSSDGTVKVWSSHQGSADSSGAAIGSAGGLRAKATLRDRSGLSASAQAILSVDVSEALVGGASTDRTVKIWDLRTERLRNTVTGHSNKVHAVKFSGEGRTLVTGSTDRTLMVWDALSGRSVRTLKANSTCNALDISSDGSTVVSGHQDGSVRLWDLGTGTQVAEAPGVHGSGQVTSVAFSPRGGMSILSAGRDNALRMLDARSLDITLNVAHSALRIGYNWSRACFSPDGCFMLCGSLNGSILVWDLAEGGRAGSAHATTTGGGRQQRGSESASTDGGGGGGWKNRFGAAIGGALGGTIGGTGLGNALGNTLGGTIGNSLTENSQEGQRGEGRASASARCHQVLTGGHDAPVTTVAWAPGVGGWNQVASVDKSGSLCVWD